MVNIGPCINLEGVNLMRVNLEEHDLTEANLTRANLMGANLTEANLEVAILTRAILTRDNLTGANLTGADLFEADLTDANLTGANLIFANLEGANLRVANLTDANLTFANLEGADLTGVNLEGVILTGANLAGATLPQAPSLKFCLALNSNIEGAITSVDQLLNSIKSSKSNKEESDIYKSHLKWIEDNMEQLIHNNYITDNDKAKIDDRRSSARLAQCSKGVNEITTDNKVGLPNAIQVLFGVGVLGPNDKGSR